MALTRAFRETVMEDMKRNPDFRRAMLCEAVDALLAGEMEVGKSILRDTINATIGFEALAEEVDIPAKSLMRMLSRSGNPQAKNLFAIVRALEDDAGISLQVVAAE